MNSSQSRTKTLVAAAVGAAVGAGMLVGVVGLLAYYIEQKKKEKNEQVRTCRKSQVGHMGSASSRKASVNSSKSDLSEDEMFTAQNSEDEYYECCGQEEEDEGEEEEELEEFKDGVEGSKEEKLYRRVDRLLKGDDKDRLRGFNMLKEKESELSESAAFLWRYAKAHQMQASACGDGCKAKEQFVLKGLEYASKALALDPGSADVHKWFAILVGMHGEFLTISKKIEGACLFYEHVNIAVGINPKDYSLHHLLGRFKLEMAGLSWLQKKLASTLFSEVPDFTYADAVTHFLKAEDLSPKPWIENRLMLARCYIGLGQREEAVQWLNRALEVPPTVKKDVQFLNEAKMLLKKYS